LRKPSLAVGLVLLLCVRAHALPHLSKPHHAKPASTRQLVIASDIHFDPFADPTLAPALARQPITKWEKILGHSSQTEYSPYGQDTNWWLLENTLDAMRKAEPNPAMVMITGDLMAHEFAQKYARSIQDTDRNHYRAFVSKTIAFVAAEVRKRYARQQIFFTPGNNDDVCGDYTIQAGGPFLNDTAWTVGGLAKARVQIMSDWKAYGSYSVEPHGVKGLRIVSLNSVFFFNGYQPQSFADGCSATPTDGPARMYSWLEKTLSAAADKREQVWLMFHIPPGIDGYSTMMNYRKLSQPSPPGDICTQAIIPMWKPFWTDLFSKLVVQYPNIAAMFAGHDHNDDLRVLHAGQPNQQFVLIDPPVSPIYGQNPSFRIVTFDGAKLTDQTTWYLTNLPSARSVEPGVWMPEYTFTEKWQSPRLDAASLNALDGRIRGNAAASQQWMTQLDVSSTYRPMPSTAPRDMECAITALDPESYKSCYCPAP
jgi:sphingomyelin phosphodiesterase acid-like 3